MTRGPDELIKDAGDLARRTNLQLAVLAGGLVLVGLSTQQRFAAPSPEGAERPAAKVVSAETPASPRVVLHSVEAGQLVAERRVTAPAAAAALQTDLETRITRRHSRRRPTRPGCEDAPVASTKPDNIVGFAPCIQLYFIRQHVKAQAERSYAKALKAGPTPAGHETESGRERNRLRSLSPHLLAKAEVRDKATEQAKALERRIATQSIDVEVSKGVTLPVPLQLAPLTWFALLLGLLARLAYQRKKFWELIIKAVRRRPSKDVADQIAELHDMPFWLAPTPLPPKPTSAQTEVVVDLAETLGWDGSRRMQMRALRIIAVLIGVAAIRMIWIATRMDSTLAYVSGHLLTRSLAWGALELTLVCGGVSLASLVWLCTHIPQWDATNDVLSPPRRPLIVGSLVGGVAMVLAGSGVAWAESRYWVYFPRFRRRHRFADLSASKLPAGFYRHSRRGELRYLSLAKRIHPASQTLAAKRLTPVPLDVVNTLPKPAPAPAGKTVAPPKVVCPADRETAALDFWMNGDSAGAVETLFVGAQGYFATPTLRRAAIRCLDLAAGIAIRDGLAGPLDGVAAWAQATVDGLKASAEALDKKAKRARSPATRSIRWSPAGHRRWPTPSPQSSSRAAWTAGAGLSTPSGAAPAGAPTIPCVGTARSCAARPFPRRRLGPNLLSRGRRCVSVPAQPDFDGSIPSRAIFPRTPAPYLAFGFSLAAVVCGAEVRKTGPPL